MHFLQQTYTSYSPNERKLAEYLKLTDAVMIPAFILFYLSVAFWLAHDEAHDDAHGGPLDFLPPGYVSVLVVVFTLVTWLVLYQHAAVAPFPTEDTVEMFGVMQHVGRWIFLTRQTLCIQAIHALMSAASLFLAHPGLTRATSAVSVLVAGLGIFVTSQYFILVASHPDFKVNGQKWEKRGVPFTLLMHYLHTPCGLFGFLDLVVIKQRGVLLAQTPSYMHIVMCYLAYTLAYTVLLHVNHLVTQQWPYGFMKDLTTPLKWVKFTMGQFCILLVFVTVALGVASYAPVCWSQLPY